MAEPIDRPFEHWKAEQALNLEAYRADAGTKMVLQRAAIDFALLTLRTLILLNGGAAIGSMTYLGNICAKAAPQAAISASLAAPGMIAFIVGLVTGTLSAGAAYIAQILFVELLPTAGGYKMAAKCGNWARIVAVILAGASVSAFCYGAWVMLGAFQTAIRH
jgi:hypothetical protein